MSRQARLGLVVLSGVVLFVAALFVLLGLDRMDQRYLSYFLCEQR